MKTNADLTVENSQVCTLKTIIYNNYLSTLDSGEMFRINQMNKRFNEVQVLQMSI